MKNKISRITKKTITVLGHGVPKNMTPDELFKLFGQPSRETNSNSRIITYDDLGLFFHFSYGIFAQVTFSLKKGWLPFSPKSVYKGKILVNRMQIATLKDFLELKEIGKLDLNELHGDQTAHCNFGETIISVNLVPDSKEILDIVFYFSPDHQTTPIFLLEQFLSRLDLVTSWFSTSIPLSNTIWQLIEGFSDASEGARILKLPETEKHAVVIKEIYHRMYLNKVLITKQKTKLLIDLNKHFEDFCRSEFASLSPESRDSIVKKIEKIIQKLRNETT